MKKLITALVSLLAFLFLVPIGGTVLGSVWEDGSIGFRGYLDLLFDCFVFYPMFWNSVCYALFICMGQLLIGGLLAFGLSQLHFRGKGLVYIGYIVLMMMPLQVTLLPNYIGLRDMGLLYTPQGIVLPLLFSPFAVVVLYQYLQGIEESMIEAARLETTSFWRILQVAVIPQMKPCIGAVTLFVFAENWNMLEQPLLFLKEDRYRTLSVFLATTEEYTGNVLLPASVLFMIPVLLLYQLLSEHLEEGLCLERVEINE